MTGILMGGQSAGIISSSQSTTPDLPQMMLCNLKDMLLAPLNGILGSKPAEAGGKKDPQGKTFFDFKTTDINNNYVDLV